VWAGACLRAPPRLDLTQANIEIHLDPAHGFPFQHATQFAADVAAFPSGQSRRRA
jgi:hypothetical protein